MKNLFPKYSTATLLSIGQSLTPTEKKLLKEFNAEIAITSNEARVKKIHRLLLEIRDVIEKPLTKFTEKDIIDFLGTLKRSEQKEWTKNDIKKALKRFVRWHYNDRNMEDRIKSVSLKNAFNFEKINKSTLITEEELEKLLRTAQTLKWKALLILMSESGARPSEIVQLKFQNVKFGNDGITEVTFIANKTGGQPRTIPLKESTVHLKRWHQEYQYPDVTDEDYVFPSPVERNKHITADSLGGILRNLCRKAGIRLLNCYLFRHTRITQLKRIKNLDPLIIKKFSGHSPDSPITDIIYTHLDNDDIKDQMLESIYNIEEIDPEKQIEYEKRIKSLEENNVEIKEKAEEMLNVVSDFFMGKAKIEDVNKLKAQKKA